MLVPETRKAKRSPTSKSRIALKEALWSLGIVDFTSSLTAGSTA